jgi:phosphoserine aminotransferase
MINFYPGPSKIYSEVPQYAQEAFELGILERNHRSEQGMELIRSCILELKRHLEIPADYSVYFVSSATEAWEICAQSLLVEPTFVYNGAFGKKWMEYSKGILPDSHSLSFEPNEFPMFPTHGDVCVVANETSNGTHIPCIPQEREGLIVMDVVSSLGGRAYEMSDVDVWIASVQKCFGLPSGMGLLILSPKARMRAKEKGERLHYNSVLFLEENFSKDQTPYTPNLLGIYLLKRVLEGLEGKKIIHSRLEQRAQQLYNELSEYYAPLIENPDLRSTTVLVFKCDHPRELSHFLEENGVLIGKGYGEWKENTFRIANFPAIPDLHYKELSRLLSIFVKK